jgi:hypothetical protein
MQNARQKSAQACSQTKSDNGQSLRATETFNVMHHHNAGAQCGQQGGTMYTESQQEAARDDIVRRQSTTANQGAQLFDDEVNEEMSCVDDNYFP